MHERIEFEGLNNTRDLGGLPAAGGRTVKPGRLIRSGHLFPASDADLRTLGDMLDLVVDMRTDNEAEEKPDPQMPGVSHIRLPIFEERKGGVTRDSRSEKEDMRAMLEDTDKAINGMISAYRRFVESEHCATQYARFIRLLLDERSGAVLWHCSAGKDRAGFASVIVETILGVDPDVIRRDYLKTNEYIEPEVTRLLSLFGADTPEKRKAVLSFLSAREEFLDASFAAARELYGGMDGYILRGMGITEEEKGRLREMFLQ